MVQTTVYTPIVIITARVSLISRTDEISTKRICKPTRCYSRWEPPAGGTEGTVPRLLRAMVGVSHGEILRGRAAQSRLLGLGNTQFPLSTATACASSLATPAGCLQKGPARCRKDRNTMDRRVKGRRQQKQRKWHRADGRIDLAPHIRCHNEIEHLRALRAGGTAWLQHSTL